MRATPSYHEGTLSLWDCAFFVQSYDWQVDVDTFFTYKAGCVSKRLVIHSNMWLITVFFMWTGPCSCASNASMSCKHFPLSHAIPMVRSVSPHLIKKINMTFWMQSVVSSQALAVEQTYIFHNHLTVGPFWVRAGHMAVEVCWTGRSKHFSFLFFLVWTQWFLHSQLCNFKKTGQWNCMIHIPPQTHGRM